MTDEVSGHPPGTPVFLLIARLLWDKGVAAPLRRPLVMTGAQELLGDPAITGKQVAERLGVSLSTLYRHMPAARATITRGEPP